MKVYNAIYTRVNSDNFQDVEAIVRSFDSEEKARAFVAKDYGDMLDTLRNDEDEYTGVISADNLGHGAEILWGNKDSEECETRYLWHVKSVTLNYDGICGKGCAAED